MSLCFILYFILLLEIQNIEKGKGNIAKVSFGKMCLLLAIISQSSSKIN